MTTTRKTSTRKQVVNKKRALKALSARSKSNRKKTSKKKETLKKAIYSESNSSSTIKHFVPLSTAQREIFADCFVLGMPPALVAKQRQLPLTTVNRTVKVLKKFRMAVFTHPDDDHVGEGKHDRMQIAMVVSHSDSAHKNDGPWSEEKNTRRCNLIDKKIDSTISLAESVELQELQQQMLAYRHSKAPLPLDYIRKVRKQLLDDIAGDQEPA
jgi:hypothetical protein